MITADREALRDFWQAYEAHRDEVNVEVQKLVAAHPEFSAMMRSTSAQQLAEQDRRNWELQRRAVLDGEWEPYLADLETQGATYAQMGIGFAAWFELVNAFRKLLVPHLYTAYGTDTQRFIAAVNSMDDFIDKAMAAIGKAYLRTKEKLIVQQQEALQELSTPVLQVRDGLLILPIIGMIDTQRARQITESLLHAIRANRAKVAVLDITGVAAVDTKVANHLAQTVEAARLMGTKAIVSGLSAEVAQTLVTLGIDLSKIDTVADLRSAIEAADRLLDGRIVTLESRSDAPAARR
jgi:rsbT co-antagonist protein RsbR